MYGSPEKNERDKNNKNNLNFFSLNAHKDKNKKEIEPIIKGKSHRERNKPEKITDKDRPREGFSSFLKLFDKEKAPIKHKII